MTPDINVLLAASQSEHPHHRPARLWLERALAACATGGSMVLLPMVVTGFMRLATNRKVVVHPVPVAAAIAYIDALLEFPGVVMPEVGREWPALRRLCLAGQLQANDIPDAWIAAVVATTGGHLVTFDRGFKRFLVRGQLTVLDSDS